jgi:hypothetical protein
MGHIIAHADISVHVIPQLEAMIPGVNFIYLELGNFMTDIAQFRDPYANIKAKSRTWDTVLSDAGFFGSLFVRLGCGKIRPWINDLMGEARGKRYGFLADFFEQIALFSTHMFFADDSRLALNLFAAASQARLPNVKPLSPAEVDRVFKCAFTQYYPHEHFDFLPDGEGPNHRTSVLYQPARRSLIGYLEEQLQFVSEELSRLERNWLQKRNEPVSDPASCDLFVDLFVRLGHILHAVEDFYFHSNAIELRQWQKLLQLHPQRLPYQKEEDYKFLVSNILQGTRHQTEPMNVKTRLARRLARRLRYPIFIEGTEGDTKASEDATKLIYTGGFGEADMFHTIHGALIVIEKVLKVPNPKGDDTGQRIRNSDLVLIKTLFNAEERRRMVNDKQYKERKVQEHKNQVLSGQYSQWIAQMQAQGRITARAGEALLNAFQKDRILEGKYKGCFGNDIPGVGGFLIHFLALIEEEVDKSEKKVQELDAKPGSIHDRATVNGASEETIGTHSLMAKDGSEKEPLREEAIALAKFASAALAVLLARRIQDDPNPDNGLDWDTLVRHFVRFPSTRANSWEEEVLASGRGNLPNIDTIQDKPKYRMLTTSDPDGKLKARRGGRKTKQLEDRYQGLEPHVDW